MINRCGHLCRAVASLTVPGGQEFYFPHFFLKFRSIFLIFPQTLLIFFLILAIRVGESPTREGPGYATAFVDYLQELNWFQYWTVRVFFCFCFCFIRWFCFIRVFLLFFSMNAFNLTSNDTNCTTVTKLGSGSYEESLNSLHCPFVSLKAPMDFINLVSNRIFLV